ncbi:MAG: helix-turn-helix domain-containing protein [Chloroflexi bacterium]|nr:helix-turn-helix domain-containing protein [Chloroflexota bacterium]
MPSTDRANGKKIYLLKTLARWPVSGRHWRLLYLGPGVVEPAPTPNHQEPVTGRGQEDAIARIEREIAEVSSRVEELDAAQTELFLQVRDLHAQIAEIPISLDRLAQQIQDLGVVTTVVELGKDGDSHSDGEEEPPLEEWISVREAARYLGVSPGTVRRYIKKGYIRAGRLPSGKRLRIPRSEVERILRSESSEADLLPPRQPAADEPPQEDPTPDPNA